MRWQKTLQTEEAGTPKVYKKRPSILNPNWGLARQERQNTLRLNGFSANPTYPEFCGQKNSDFSGRMEVALSLFERVAPTPRNPYKTSAKPLLGESGRTPGTRFPFLEGKMWPDSPPTADIYIYISLSLSLPSLSLYISPSLPLSLSIYIYIYISLSIPLSIYIYIYIHTYIYIYISLSPYLYIYIYIYVYILISISLYLSFFFSLTDLSPSLCARIPQLEGLKLAGQIHFLKLVNRLPTSHPMMLTSPGHILILCQHAVSWKTVRSCAGLGAVEALVQNSTLPPALHQPNSYSCGKRRASLVPMCFPKVNLPYNTTDTHPMPHERGFARGWLCSSAVAAEAVSRSRSGNFRLISRSHSSCSVHLGECHRFFCRQRPSGWGCSSNHEPFKTFKPNLLLLFHACMTSSIQVLLQRQHEQQATLRASAATSWDSALSSIRVLLSSDARCNHDSPNLFGNLFQACLDYVETPCWLDALAENTSNMLAWWSWMWLTDLAASARA